MKKPILSFKSDSEAEAFVDTADLSQYDLSGGKPTRFEFSAKESQINMRVPAALLEGIKERAREKGIPYTRLIRMLMEQALTHR
ncbi:MAG TPA: BrnA antitoxin family protein [Acetobacteraceae bacterium]